MKFQTLVPVAAALLVVAFVLAFRTPEVKEERLPIAPIGIIPIGGADIGTSTPGLITPFLGGLQIGPTGNSFLDRFLTPPPAPIAESVATTGPEGSTTSPAAAAVIGSKKETPVTVDPLISSTSALSKAIVNILCVPKDGLKAVSGTGVIIDSRGVILTVAHVGQMYLLRDYPTEGNVTCVVRTGSPAKNAYLAEPIYVSTDWIRRNPDTLVAAAPTGTGQYDFALLVIRQSVTGTPLPVSFPSVPLSDKTPQGKDKVGIGTYGAQYLSAAQVRNELYPTIVYSAINNRYTFNEDTVDVISVRGGAAAQQGSSGGGIVNTSGELIGLITTSTVTGDIAKRDTRAITPRHIREAFKKDTGQNLSDYIAKEFGVLVAGYSEDVAILRGILVDAIE